MIIFIYIGLLWFYCTKITRALPSDQITEQILFNSLVSDSSYNKFIRPSFQVNISVTMCLKQIVSLDEKNNILVTSSSISQEWNDPRLTWNTTAYEGIESLIIPATKIWVPDTFILNSGDSNGYLTVTSSSLAVVYYDGTVYLVLPTIAVKTRCSLYHKLYPFDSQTCSILITSWALTSSNINYALNGDALDINEYSEHPVWSLTSYKLSDISESSRNPWENAQNSQLNIVLELKRKPLYYIMNGVFPCLILNIVILMAFSLPFPAQMGTSMSSFMTYAVYSLRISSELPTQSDFLPTISIYFLFSIIFTNCCMVWFIVHNELSKLKILPKPVLFVCKIFKKIANIESTEKKETDRKSEFLPLKCNKCDRCEECENDFQKEENKKKMKDENENHLKYFNRFVFLVAVICMLIGQFSIWSSY